MFPLLWTIIIADVSFTLVIISAENSVIFVTRSKPSLWAKSLCSSSDILGVSIAKDRIRSQEGPLNSSAKLLDWSLVKDS